MRFLALLPVILLCAAGCARDDGAAVPERGGHAYVLPGASGGGSSGAPLVSRSQSPEAGETTVTYEPGDRLYRIAEEHGVSLEWLIRRNDLVDHPPRAGQQLIVPR